jgi:hypothetical protein
MFGHFRGGANQDAADEAIRTGEPVKLGLLERLYGGTKEDAENIVKTDKKKALESAYGSDLARLGLMVDWGESEQSVKSKIFATAQKQKAGQEAKVRAQNLKDSGTVHERTVQLAQQGFDANAAEGRLSRDAAKDQYLHSSKTQEARYAHERSEGRLDRRQQMELSDSKDGLQMQMAIMNNDLAEKRMDYDRETRSMDKRDRMIAQLMSGLGSLGAAFG